MNMVALAFIGPFLEFALGSRRYLAVYLLTGVGSMMLVMAFQKSGLHQLTVGASGAIMGLIGATGGVMLRHWLRERGTVARRKLTSILLIVLSQTMLDAVIPEISMTAHLSGALLGFTVILCFPERSVGKNGAR
jgi:rhomboid protease GluP